MNNENDNNGFLTDLDFDFSQVFGLFKTIIKISTALGESIAYAQIISEVNDLLPYIDCTDVPDYALDMLKSMELSPAPKMGLESITAITYLYMAFFHAAKEEYEKALYCTSVVSIIPNRKIFNRNVVVEVKEYAAKFSQKIKSTIIEKQRTKQTDDELDRNCDGNKRVVLSSPIP